MKLLYKKAIICLLALISVLWVGAQNKNEKVVLTGTITDASTGEALVGASISLPDLRRGTASNQQGKYTIGDLNPGKYLIEVSFTGYASRVQTIQLVNNAPVDFALKPSFLETEAVTVTGVSSATSVRRTPVPVNIVKKEELLKGASTNLVDALSRTPGVSQIATGPAISKPVIRGLGYNRVVIVNDGIRQEGQQWGDEHGLEIDELNVNRAEVLKGPASLMYGSDALAGVINLVSIIPAPIGTIKGNVLANYQTNNRQRALHGDIGGNNNGFIWGAYGSYKAAGDYQNKYDGFVYNSGFNEKNYGGYLGLNKTWGFSHLYFSQFDQSLGLVEGDRDSATGRFIKMIDQNGMAVEEIVPSSYRGTQKVDVPKQRVRHLKLATDNSLRLGGGRLTATVGYQRNLRQEFGNVLDPTETGLDFNLETVNYNVQYHFAQQRNWKTTVGVNGMWQQNTNAGTEALIPQYHLFDVGGFLFTQRTFNNVSLSGGIRVDNRGINSQQFVESGHLKFEGFTKNFSNVSASIGASYNAGEDVTLKLNIARGFRAPSIPELASNGAHEGTNRYEYGTRNLKSERSLQADAGIDFQSDHISLSANLFVNSINNYIYYRKLNAVTGGDSILSYEGDDFFAFRYDQSNATLYGGEANFDIHPHPLHWLHIENSFSYVRGKLATKQDGSNNLPFIPAARLINEVKGDFLKKGKGLKDVYLKFELDNTFAQNQAFTGFNTETPTPGYSLLNAGFGGTVTNKGKALFSLYFSANNISDVAYQNHLSRLKYTDVNNVTGRQGVFNMGRNFSLKVNVPLSASL